MENKYQDDLHSIRELMERSVKVDSVSGLAGILAGCYALAGAGLFYKLLPVDYAEYIAASPAWKHLSLKLLAVPIVVLLVALASVVWLSYRKSVKLNVSLLNASAQRLALNMAVPLTAGGIFILILLFHGYVALAAPACLLFYGIALAMAGTNTFVEIRYLGFLEIILGLIAAARPDYGLIVWTLGFGVLNILYGGVMYKKYER